MWLALTAAPSETPVSLAEAKAHLRVLHANDDTAISALIAVATRMVDGRYGLLGRPLVTQSWEYRIDAFPDCGTIVLPLPPLISVGAVTYVDGAGAVQTLSASQYVVDTATFEGQIRRGYGLDWPATRDEPHAVRIVFTAGFGAAAAVEQPIKQALLLMIGHWYANREAVSEASLKEVPMSAKWLLGPYKMQAV